MHKKLTEFQAKKALNEYLSLDKLIVEVTQVEQLTTLSQRHPWLQATNLVAKPDIGIGKRAKRGLISLKNDWPATRDWIEHMWGRKVESSNFQPATIDRFIIEEYIPHGIDEEFFLSIRTQPENDVILFSSSGGVNIEEDWSRVSSFEVDLEKGIEPSKVETILNQYHFVSSHDTHLLAKTIMALYAFFVEWSFVELEINPLVMRKGQFHILDIKASIDSDAYWQKQAEWDQYDFMDKDIVSQTSLVQDEKYIRELDAASGSSLKCKFLNPNGSIWPLTAGGGASIVIMDALDQRGLTKEVGFYGEYSGNPDNQLMQAYTETILKYMVAAQTNHPKVLLILGATANFTNVKETFIGIIKALETYAIQLKEQNVTVLVRRGGPNQEEGLKHMEETLTWLDLSHEVHGPDIGLTELVWKI